MTRKLTRLISVCVLLGCLTSTGCARMLESLLCNALGASTIKDGRDEDAGGLTRRDMIARGEEQYIRQIQAEHQYHQWKGYNQQLESAENPTPFEEPWHEFLNRDRE